jgi:hypothetical protein
MSIDRDTIIGQLISELSGLVFTGDPVVNYLAPNAIEKLARLRTLLGEGQYAAAIQLVERDLAPTLQKLEDVLGELVERNVSPFKDLPAVNKVMDLCREFQEVHRAEFERSVTER